MKSKDLWRWWSLCPMLCTTFFVNSKRTKHINYGTNPYTGQAVHRKLILLRFLSAANRQNTSQWDCRPQPPAEKARAWPETHMKKVPKASTKKTLSCCLVMQNASLSFSELRSPWIVNLTDANGIEDPLCRLAMMSRQNHLWRGLRDAAQLGHSGPHVPTAVLPWLQPP